MECEGINMEWGEQEPCKQGGGAGIGKWNEPRACDVKTIWENGCGEKQDKS